MAYNTAYLQHHGINGMRWGKRNGPPYPLSDKQVTKMKKQSIRQKAKTLSDDELNKQINRLRKEQEYIKLTSSDITAGNEFIKTAILAAGTLFVTNLFSSASREAGAAIISKILKK